MKKNNGFTLIELLAVILILVAVALVAFPSILNTINKSERQIDETTQKIVKNAAKLYIDNNINEYPRVIGNTYCITFVELINTNYLESGIIEGTDIDASTKTVKVIVTDKFDYEIVNNSECTEVKN